jgi:hypothetical protein
MHTQEAVHSQCALLQTNPGSAHHVERRTRAEPFAYAEQDAATKPADYSVGARITCVDRAIIRTYFAESESEVPTVAAGGYEKPRRRSRRDWTAYGRLLPQTGARVLPANLEEKLSALQPGYKRLTVGSDVLLIETASRKILEIMHNANLRAERRAA